jgi:hypothetical protein
MSGGFRNHKSGLAAFLFFRWRKFGSSSFVTAFWASVISLPSQAREPNPKAVSLALEKRLVEISPALGTNYCFDQITSPQPKKFFLSHIVFWGNLRFLKEKRANQIHVVRSDGEIFPDKISCEKNPVFEFQMRAYKKKDGRSVCVKTTR